MGLADVFFSVALAITIAILVYTIFDNDEDGQN